MLLGLGYRLRRHYVMGWPMDVLCVVGCAVGSLVALRTGDQMVGAVLMVLALGGLVLAVVSRRAGYVLFRPAGQDSHPLELAAPRPNTELSVRATGRFAIRDQARYLADQPAILTTPGSREHILMARLRSRRWMLVGRSHADEWGYWYQFIKPNALVKVELGRAAHGWRLRAALRVHHQHLDQNDIPVPAVTILAFDDQEGLALAWANLMLELRERAATRPPKDAFRKNAPGRGESGVAAPDP